MNGYLKVGIASLVCVFWGCAGETEAPVECQNLKGVEVCLESGAMLERDTCTSAEGVMICRVAEAPELNYDELAAHKLEAKDEVELRAEPQVGRIDVDLLRDPAHLELTLPDWAYDDKPDREYASPEKISKDISADKPEPYTGPVRSRFNDEPDRETTPQPVANQPFEASDESPEIVLTPDQNATPSVNRPALEKDRCFECLQSNQPNCTVQCINFVSGNE